MADDADFGSRMQTNDSAIEQARRLLGHPLVKHSYRILTDPFVTRSSYELMTHPKKTNLFFWELGWLVFFIFFRSWWMAKIPKWYKRALLTLLSLAGFWIVAALVIPWGVIWSFDWSWLKEWAAFVGRVFRG
jgi:hypothetical protein